CWYYLTTPKADFWLVCGYLGFILPVFLLSAFHALSVCTTRVTLATQGMVVRRFGVSSTPVPWSEVCEVYRSAVTPAIVFVTRDRRRVCISTHLDGVQAIREYLPRVAPGVVHRSVTEWLVRLW